MKRTFYGIEAGRGIAALLVAVYHISRLFEQNFGFFPFGNISEIGHSGVDFFFVLSGFIIFYIHEKDFNHPQAFKPYIVKRCVRVFPLYWILFMATFMLIPFVESAEFPTVFGFITQFLLLPIGMNELVLGVSWTLQYEMFFYLAFACFLFNKAIGLGLNLCWLAVVIMHNYIQPLSIATPVIFSPFIIQFFMGAFAAYIVLHKKMQWCALLLYTGLIYLALLYFFEFYGYLNGYGKFARVYYGTSFTLIVIGLVGIEKERPIFIPKVLLSLGKASYSIYLSHLFFCGVYFKIFDIIGVFDLLTIPLSACLLIGGTVYSSILLSRWVEFPVTSKIKHYLSRKLIC